MVNCDVGGRKCSGWGQRAAQRNKGTGQFALTGSIIITWFDRQISAGTTRVVIRIKYRLNRFLVASPRGRFGWATGFNGMMMTTTKSTLLDVHWQAPIHPYLKIDSLVPCEIHAQVYIPSYFHSRWSPNSASAHVHINNNIYTCPFMCPYIFILRQ